MFFCLGEIPERPKGADCKSVGVAFAGSNPALPNKVYIMNSIDENLFFSDGLQFDCTRCQRCCRVDTGYVFLSETDLRNLSKFLNLSVREIISRYCREVKIGNISRLSLKEEINFDCVFWKDDGCTVYSERPLQCRTFPFWSSNVFDEKTWQEAGKDCPGIDIGPFHSAKKISFLLQSRIKEPLIQSLQELEDLKD